MYIEICELCCFLQRELLASIPGDSAPESLEKECHSSRKRPSKDLSDSAALPKKSKVSFASLVLEFPPFICFIEFDLIHNLISCFVIQFRLSCI